MKKTMNLKRIMALVVCALTLCVLGSCVKEVTYGRIQGIITDANDNEPIQGVNVQLSPTGLSTVTGSDGRYEFLGLEAGQYTVQAMATGYQTNTKTIEITTGNISSGDMMLKPEVAGFKLSVEYLDFGTGFDDLSFKIINTSKVLPVSWSITESYNWMTVTPSSGELLGGKEVAVHVSIDRQAIESSITANISVVCEEETVVLPVNVTISGSNGPKLQLSTTELNFGTEATQLYFDVMNSGLPGTSLNWTSSHSDVEWLDITPTEGNLNGGSSKRVVVTIDRSLFTGDVSAKVNISGAGTVQSVTINASSEGSGIPIMQLSESKLDFGDTENTKTFKVENVGNAVLEWSITPPSEEWLTINPLSGMVNPDEFMQVTVAVDRDQFEGQVQATVKVKGTNSTITLKVLASNLEPSLAVSPATLDFGKNKTDMNFFVKNDGQTGSTLTWTIEAPDESWITINPLSGSTQTSADSKVTVHIDRTAFTGQKETTIKVKGADSEETVHVIVDNSVLVTDGLFCFFDFDDENIIVDWAENYTGINSGTTSSGDTPSGEGRSRVFNGEAFIRVAGSIVAPGGPFTINLWYKTGSNNQYLIGSDAKGDYNQECTLSLTSNQNIRYEAGNKSGSWAELTWVSNPIASYIDNQWHMMTITFNGSLGEIYMDGELKESKVSDKLAWGTGTGNSAVNVTFFGVNNNENYYNGKIDNYRSYNRALTAEEIQLLFDNKQ